MVGGLTRFGRGVLPMLSPPMRTRAATGAAGGAEAAVGMRVRCGGVCYNGQNCHGMLILV